MTETLPCQSCFRAMSASAATCPHCGVHQSRSGKPAPVMRPAAPRPAAPRPATPAKRGLEAPRVEAPAPVVPVLDGDPDAGAFSGLLAPHPSSTPAERRAQVLLTIVAFPVILSTFLFVGLLYTRAAMRTHQHRNEELPAPSIASPIALAFGAIPLAVVLASRIDPPVVVTGIVLQWVALGLRAYVRQRARRRSR